MTRSPLHTIGLLLSIAALVMAGAVAVSAQMEVDPGMTTSTPNSGVAIVLPKIVSHYCAIFQPTKSIAGAVCFKRYDNGVLSVSCATSEETAALLRIPQCEQPK